MASYVFVLRFFRVVPPVPRPLVVVCLAAVAASACLALTAPARTCDTLPGLLVLQIFATSSGVLGAARRGYYDALLSRGVGRVVLLAGHWSASIAPGIVCWLCVAGLDYFVNRMTSPPVGVATGSLVAFWLASSLPWAVTVSLPRFAAGIGWLVGLATALSTIPTGQTALLAALRQPDLVSWAPLAPVVYPMGLLGLELTPNQWRMVLPGIIGSVLLSLATGAWFTRADLPLETSQ